MLHKSNPQTRPGRLLACVVWAMSLALSAFAQNSPGTDADAPPAITNLLELTQLLNREARGLRDVRLEATVCAASEPKMGVLILQDATAVELVEVESGPLKLIPGDRIRIEGRNCLLRRRNLGVEITAAPVVDNDGIHETNTMSGTVMLAAGRHPLKLEWFNQFRDFSLEVTCQTSNAAPEPIPSTALWHQVTDEVSGKPVFQPGLRVECFEGNWEIMPDFDLLPPVKTGVTTNFGVQFQTRNEMAGLRFTGFFEAPAAGRYTFSTRSDDGSLLFIGAPGVQVTKLGSAAVRQANPAFIGDPLRNIDERRWVTVEGRVGFASPAGKGLELELRSEANEMRVRIADAAGLNAAALLNARVRVTGVGRASYNLDRRIVLGHLFAAAAKDLVLLDTISGVPTVSSPLVTAQQVQMLSLEDAKRNLPVHLRGVVTSLGPQYQRWLSIQDDTRGIFVGLRALSNGIPICGESCEIIGHSGAGDFAPVVVADQIIRLGQGGLPEPARPVWNELINGSMDMQWVEFQGLVTDVHSNVLSLLLPGGQFSVTMRGYGPQLELFNKSVVRIRGVLFSDYNIGTRQVRVGSIRVHNASINVDIPAPANPFDAVLKTPRELLLFDAQAAPFRRVKVRGQIIYAGAGQLFLMQDEAGVRLLPASAAEVRAGDLVEAVGYPDISGTAVLLREAILRKTGHAVLLPAEVLAERDLTREDLDSKRVRVEGELLGWHTEQGAQVFEMQSGRHLYLARLTPENSARLSLRAGSQLALTGVYAGPRRLQSPEIKGQSFELLLNSPMDILVLSQPPWWTLPRLFLVVGILLGVLIFTAIWIKQLRRLVEQRTTQLQREIREREHVERQHALEAERSRIARDLHDDLGSSLTEISVLASTGQRPHTDENSSAKLFHAIVGKARSLVTALDVIVWAVDPEDNSLQSLADYLSGFTGDYLAHSGIACRVKVPVSFPPVTIDGQVRHGLLMAVKETLNNIVRHAHATEVEFHLALAEGGLEIALADDGKGIENPARRDRHGLKNLSARLEKLGGSCRVESRVGGGTTVRFRLPLPPERKLQPADV